MSISTSDRGSRRKADDVRDEALAIGRRLLVEGGPAALTLKAVAGAMAMSHANLIHHFGSAEAFQSTLKARMVEDLTRTATALVARGDTADPTSIVDMVFEAYAAGGIGTLMAWSALFQTGRGIEGPLQAVQDLVAALEPQIEGHSSARRAREMVCLVTSLALADSLIGKDLATILQTDGQPMRTLAVELLQKLGDAETSRSQPAGAGAR